MTRDLSTVPPASQALTRISPLQLYLQEISKIPLLTPEEEFELAKAHFDEGDVAAAHRLVTANLRLVVKIANDFRQAQANLLEDLIQEGNAGLIQAVKKFNPYKGVKLSSYAAWWIKAYVLKFIMDNKSQVKIGTTAAQRKLFFNLRREANRLLSEYDAVDTKLLAERLDVREIDVIQMQNRLNSPDISLDAPLNGSGDEGLSRGATIAAEVLPADEAVAAQEVREIFSHVLEEFAGTLKGREKDLFEARLIAEEPLTLQEIGNKYGITRERARQIEVNVIRKLKEFANKAGLIDIDPS
jgi:RNA polymerase sigma-32 factor